MKTQYIKRKSNKYQKKKCQKLIGIFFIACIIPIVMIALNGTTIEERDVGAAIPCLALGIWFLCSKKTFI